MSGTSETGGDAGHVPNQLAILVPTFDPAVDNAEIWTNKVELLLLTWPPTKIQELATRLVLGCKGTAFQKLQLHRDEILVNDTKGIQKIVELVGGKWGAVPLEKKFEIVEKALFRGAQKSDETSDSYLSRCDVIWTELVNKKIDIKEIQAYILLRGSRLSSDDKKRVLVESGAESGANLTVKSVEAAIRMIGSGFFQDMIGNKRDKSLKTYDHTAFSLEETAETPWDADGDVFWASDETLDDATLEALAAEDDEDAALVLQFEDAVSDLVQNDNELGAYYSTYQDARKRLSEKFRFRGFWSVKKGEKGGGKKGKGKGKSKASLATRIANSYCRLCMKKGHWKNECPNKGTSGGSSNASTVPTSFVTASEVPAEVQSLDVSEDCRPTAEVTDCFVSSTHQIFGRILGKIRGNRATVSRKWPTSSHASCPDLKVSQALEGLSQRKHSQAESTADVDSKICPSLFASSGSIGVVDLGASQTVIGSQQVPELLSQLPVWVRKQVKRVPCNLIFRFGNHQTLVSRHALLLPLGSQRFQIAVVEGPTPFLISSKFLKGIKAVIDTDLDVMWSKQLNRNLKITRTVKNLILMDLNQLWESPETSPQCSFHVEDSSRSVSEPDKTEVNASVSAHTTVDQDAEISNNPGDNQMGVMNNNGDQRGVMPQESQVPSQMHTMPQDEPMTQHSSEISGSKHSCQSQSVSTTAVVDHGVQPFRETADSPCPKGDQSGCRSDASDQADDPRGTGERNDSVWEGKGRDEVCSSLRGSQMDRLVCFSVREERQGCPSEVHHLRGEAPGLGNRSESFQGSQAQGQQPEVGFRSLMEPCEGGGPGERSQPRGCESPHRPVTEDGKHGRSDVLSLRGEPVPTPAHERSRSCTERADHACQGAQSDAIESDCFGVHSSIHDIVPDFDFSIPEGQHEQSFKTEVKKLVKQFSAELKTVKTPRVYQRRLDLLEVMCHSDSELTKQALHLGGKAHRFGLDQGDLSTTAGRMQLFQELVTFRPKHVWYSPVCKPWCKWSQYNEQRSLELQAKIFHERLNHLWQVALGIVLFRHQKEHGNHFDLEQPDGSLLKKVPGMQEVLNHTHCCRFDMCEVGQLRDPLTNQSLRKRMEVLSTSNDLFRSLHKRFCSGNHDHQHIAGQTMVDGIRFSLSKFTEEYPSRFARQVARCICHEQSQPMLVSRLESPKMSTEDHPTKKRRLAQKTDAETIAKKFPSVNWQTVMKLADSTARRVGTMVIDNGPLLEQVQEMCPQHEIKHLVLCRGTDRYVGPNKTMYPGDAPLRRMICIRRKVEGLYVDEEWEAWERLTYKGLRRKAVAARLSLTMFARPRVIPVPTAEPSADTAIPAARVHGLERPESPSSKRHRRQEPSSHAETPPVPFHHESTPHDMNSNLHYNSQYNPETVTPNPLPLEPQDMTASGEGESNHESSEKTETNGEARQAIDLASQRHGPKFLQLPSNEQSWLLKIHRNLGHPGSPKLVEFCRQLKCPERILQAIPDLQCSTCKETQMPRIARPSAIHEHGDFGDVIAMDGITWTNKQGEQFHFYHFLDQSTLYHTAVCSVSRSSQHASQALLQGWLQWAGAPKLLVMDAASEFNSEEFGLFLQRFGIKSRTCATEGHWQNSRVERHGGILQMILNKMDHEEGITSYHQLSVALAQATMTKNQWSRYRGYPPEMLVFGKGSKLGGSVVNDEETASHHAALHQTPDGVRFREELATRERARRAFVSIDNDQVLRTALTSRSRPNRGHYSPGTWIMLWKRKGEAEGQWEGPMQVIIQEENKVVWVTKGTKLYRAAPEHVRPLSAVEEWHQDMSHASQSQITSHQSSIVPPHGGTQFHNLPMPVNIPHNPNPNDQSQQPVPSAEMPVSNHESQRSTDQSAHSDPEPEAAPSEPDGSDPSNARASTESPPAAPAVMSQSQVDIPIDVPVPTDDDEFFAEEVDCFSLIDDMAWRFEVDISQRDVDQWRAEEHPMEMSFLVSAAKRQRSEVKMSQLTNKEKELFHQAKLKEIDSWLATETVARVLRHQIPEANIMRCRWILTWKPVDSNAEGPKQHVPKARLVVLGYEDPLVHEIPRDSPTMSKLSRMLILQLAASNGWDIESFDIKTAFLRGSEQGDRVLGIEPTAELRERLKLQPNEVLQLLKGAYGRVDAPYLWFMELKRGLESLGFSASPFDPCTFVLVNPKTGTTEGVIGIHVDDGLCCGSKLFQDKLMALSKMFPFGSHKKRNFTFTGLRIDQQPDHTIHINQTQYVKDIHPIAIAKNRKMHPDEPVNENERQSLRGLIGSLQYAAVNTRPDLCSRLGNLQSQINKAKISTLNDANKTLHEAKMHSDVTLKIQPISINQLRFAAFSDASFASAKIPDSHQGMMIMSCHEELGRNRTSVVNPVMWHSKKIQKVAVSTLSAEAMALAGAVDMLSWVRLYWGWLIDTKIPWKQADQTLLQLPPAFAAIPPAEDEQSDTPHDKIQQLLHQLPKSNSGIITTDCKSLYDLISRTAPPSCQEFRTLLQAKLIKEHLQNGIQIRWVPSGAQVADSLTKVMDNAMLRECLQLGKYCLHDESEILKARSDSRSRLQWLRQNANTYRE